MNGSRNGGRIVAAIVLLPLALGGCACRRGTAPSGASGNGIAGRGGPPRSPAEIEASGYHLTPAENAAVGDFLRRHQDLRVAVDTDRRGSNSGDGDVHGLYGVYHPYFVRGDLNDDGVLDFVLAFVHRSSGRAPPWFSVVVFTGRGPERGFNPGTFLERDVSLARGDLSIDRDAILVTPDLSDEAVRRYRWDPVRGSYVFVRDDEEQDEPPMLSRT